MYLHIFFVTDMMKLFLPLMLGNKQGQVLNVGSTGSYISCPYDAVYAAAKSYILSVSKGINAELKVDIQVKPLESQTQRRRADELVGNLTAHRLCMSERINI